MSNPDQGSSEQQTCAALGADLIIPALACALTFYYLISTIDLVWEARATGTVIGLILLTLCIALFIRFGLRIAAGRASLSLGNLFTNSEFDRQRYGLAAMVMIYVVTIHWVGATVGLFFLLIGCMWLLGVTRIRTLLGVALITAIIVHLLLITLLDSKLPRGLIVDQFSPTPASETTSKKK